MECLGFDYPQALLGLVDQVGARACRSFESCDLSFSALPVLGGGGKLSECRGLACRRCVQVVLCCWGSRDSRWGRRCLGQGFEMGISKKGGGGALNIPQNSIILIKGTPKRVPLF